MDTVVLARQDRQQQGPCEVEVCYGDEVDLHQHFVACDKNPGHQQFIPMDKFTMDNLPTTYRSDTLVDLIHILAGVTVRVSTKRVSAARPTYYPGTEKPYPYSNTKVKDNMKMMTRVGTGWIFNVHMCPDEYGTEKTCSCTECRNSPTPKTKFAHIFIYTAAHVVYDDIEAEHATCDLFYDSGATPESCSGVITLTGFTRSRCHAVKDQTRMTYVTHDLDLANRLGNLLDRWIDLHCKLKDTLLLPVPCVEKSECCSVEHVPETKNKLTVIVSHPHGCSKKVSLGYCTNIAEMEDGYTQYTYTTDTCPGSSGAPVFLVGRSWRYFWAFVHIHCGSCEDNKKLNFSTYCLDEIPP